VRIAGLVGAVVDVDVLGLLVEVDCRTVTEVTDNTGPGLIGVTIAGVSAHPAAKMTAAKSKIDPCKYDFIITTPRARTMSSRR